MPAGNTLDIDGVPVAVSRLEKVFYPKTGFTKGDVIDYYIRISPFLLPHLKNRPISLKRYPNGVEASFFMRRTALPTGRMDEDDRGAKVRR